MHTIMIVDDEPNVLAGLRRTFSRVANTRVLTCEDPYEALEIAAIEEVDLFISDYQMPKMNGVEFLVFARELHPDAVRFLLSGGDDFNGLANAINKAQIHRFIAKPVVPEELLFTVRQLISQRAQEQQAAEFPQ